MASNQDLISIIRTEAISDIYRKIKEGFELIGNPRFSPNDLVILKPNLCCIKGAETGATTDPKVVEGIIKYLKKDYGLSNIFIVESDGTQVLADMAFKLLGYERLSKKFDVGLINLSRAPFFYKLFEHNVFLKKIRVPHILGSANWLISVPKIKMNTMCSFSGTLKNQYGCNPYPKKANYHKRLHDAIVDLNFAFKPGLVVVDGIVAMEGSGPVDGTPIKMNTLVFGRDPVAVDHLIARIMGLDPNRVEYLVEAQRRGLGTANYKVVGKTLKEIEKKFRTRPGRRNFYGLFSRN